MSWVMAGVASAQLTYAVYQGVVANNEKKDAEKAAEEAIENYKKIETRNVMGALQIPTKGIELEERNLSRATAGQVEAMQEAGAAGVIGGTGRLTQAVGAQSESQAARIDRMQAERDRIVLSEEQRLERERADRLRNVELMRLQGAQAAAAQAADQQQMAIQSGVEAVGTGAAAYSASLNPYGKQGQGSLQKVETRGTESLLGASASSQPEFQEIYLDSLGQPYNPAYQTPTYGPLSGGMTTPTVPPSNFNYAALGYLSGNS